MMLKKGLSCDDFWYQQGWGACCPMWGAGGCPMPGPRNQENRALCSHGWLCYLPGILQGNPSPHPPTHCLSPMSKEELAWEPVFYWRRQNKTSFMSTLKLQNLLGKGIGKPRRPTFKVESDRNGKGRNWQKKSRPRLPESHRLPPHGTGEFCRSH